VGGVLDRPKALGEVAPILQRLELSFQGTDTVKDGSMQSTAGIWRFSGGTGKLKGNCKGQGHVRPMKAEVCEAPRVYELNVRR